MSLAPCPSCSRHVKTTEASCPFCKTTLADLSSLNAAVPIVKHRMTRAAAYAFGASLVVTGCVTGTVPDPGDGGTQGDGTGTRDGGAGKKDSGGGDFDADEGNIQPPYGAPAYGAVPVDSGSD